MACPAYLVCFISAVNGRIKKRKKKPWKPGASSRHITNLKPSIFCLSISMGLTHKYQIRLNMVSRGKYAILLPTNRTK